MYDETAPSYIIKMVKKWKLQIESRRFDYKAPISVVELSIIFKLSCDTSRIHGGAEMRLLPHFVSRTMPDAHTGWMRASNKSSLIAYFVTKTNSH